LSALLAGRVAADDSEARLVVERDPERRVREEDERRDVRDTLAAHRPLPCDDALESLGLAVGEDVRVVAQPRVAGVGRCPLPGPGVSRDTSRPALDLHEEEPLRAATRTSTSLTVPSTRNSKFAQAR